MKEFKKEIINYLKEISKISIELIWSKKEKWIVYNLAIFWDSIPKNLNIYKNKYFKNLEEKYKKLEKIKKEIKKDSLIDESSKKFLNNELKIKIGQINFLKKSYDIEANKIDKNYPISKKQINYNYYNKLFYQLTDKDINKNIKIELVEKKDKNLFISKEKLISLIKYTNKIVPEVKIELLDNVTWMAHDNGTLKIPDEKYYSIKSVIVLFFHEMTHFFRYLNWKRNIWFNYIFGDYDSLEEWLALYNEYFYWNKIINYWKYIPYYDICYSILSDKNTNIEEKNKKVIEILNYKWFSKDKSVDNINRFYRYTEKWKYNFFIKDLIYTFGYNNVTKLLKKDKNNYEKIFAWRLWLYEIENNILENTNNFDSKYYFDKIEKEIKLLIK